MGFPSPRRLLPLVNVSWRTLGKASTYELSIEGVPSSIVKTDLQHGVLDFSKLPDACWVVKVHAVSPSSAVAASLPQRVVMPIANGTCPRY